jgi:hypothetical protein
MPIGKPKTINSIPESRDRLYFDQWEYAFSFWLKEAHILRHRDHKQFHNYIDLRRSWTQWQPRFTDDVITNLGAAFDYINGITQPFKLVVSGHWATIYSNDPDLSDQMLAACGFLAQCKQKQAVVDQPRDTVFLLEPKHQLRSYFKAQAFPVEKLPALRDFFAAEGEAITPCPSMQNFLKNTTRVWNNKHWLPDHYFVDYDNPAYATMLAMIMPRAFRKTVSIVQRINS